MDALLLRSPPPSNLRRPLFRYRPAPSWRCFSSFSPSPSAKGLVSAKVPKPSRDPVQDWVSGNDGTTRSLPIYVGGFALFAVLLNRAFSGVAPVAEASSSQSRADILSLALAVTNLLTGLVWLSIRPKNISPVVPNGVECRRINPLIPERAVHEMLWVWESLLAATCCRSLVVVYGNICALQIGVAAKSSSEDGDAVDVDEQKLIQGPLYRSVMKSGKQNYLANLSLYPGRSEIPFLPPNTQPIGDGGIAIIGGNTIRGFTNTDQAWITLIAEKLDAVLSSS